MEEIKQIIEEIKQIIKKIIERGGVNASQDWVLELLRENSKAVRSLVTNEFAQFWYNDGKRLEEKGRKFNHIIFEHEKKGMVLLGKLGLAQDWFNYAIIMFEKTTPEFRPSSLKNEILPHIKGFAIDFKQEELLERVRKLEKETPNNNDTVDLLKIGEELKNAKTILISFYKKISILH